ncbi:MAG: hypothetical protein ACI9QC_000321 [Oceanicoccus sp.]|jgi:hypothetical protein
MSATQRVKQGFLRLPTAKKLLLISSFTLMISAVLPWYDNQNSFGAGETYLGIQGPLFMVGLLVLGLGLANFLNMFLPLFGKNFARLRRKSGVLSMILGAQSGLLLLVGNTVFLHPEFGTNANHKATSFGMTIALISVGTLIISGWWAKRKELSGEYDKKEQELEEMDEAMAAIKAVTPPAPEPIPVSHAPLYTPPARPQAQYQAPQYQTVQPEPAAVDNTVDPLTLDAKTRYKLMKQRMRHNETSRQNLWGTANTQSDPYGANRTGSRLP